MNCTIRVAKTKALISFADLPLCFCIGNNPVFSRHGSCYPDDLENEPVHEKTNSLGFRPGPTQTGLYSHRTLLEAGNFVFK